MQDKTFFAAFLSVFTGLALRAHLLFCTVLVIEWRVPGLLSSNSNNAKGKRSTSHSLRVLTTVHKCCDHAERLMCIFDFTYLMYCGNRSYMYKIIAAYGQLLYKAEVKGNQYSTTESIKIIIKLYKMHIRNVRSLLLCGGTGKRQQ